MSTNDQELTDSDLIDRAGGTFAVARLCDVKPPSVSEWRTKGIPKARRMYLKQVRPDVFGEPPPIPMPAADAAA